MKNKEIVGKVLEKLSGILSKNVRNAIEELCVFLKKAPASEYLELIESFKKSSNLSDEQYAKALELIVDAKVFMGEDCKTRDASKIKILKSITDHPPVKVFFDRTY